MSIHLNTDAWVVLAFLLAAAVLLAAVLLFGRRGPS